MPVRIIVTEGTTADCQLGEKSIEGIDAQALLGDHGYDVNAIIKSVIKTGLEVVRPPKKDRKDQHEYDKYLYKLRHLVENAFLKLKAWRGIATRYAKKSRCFLAAVQIRSMILWLRVQTN